MTETTDKAIELTESLQNFFLSELTTVSMDSDSSGEFQLKSWERNEGLNGGGNRFEWDGEDLFSSASINYSSVHYQDQPEKPLFSATALSTIVHPQNPWAPSLHMHISWTEYKNGQGYFRIMADLNPSQTQPELKEEFLAPLKDLNNTVFELACAQGDQYFHIPALDRHRGVAHYYLEQFNTGDFAKDSQFAEAVGMTTIRKYIELLNQGLSKTFNETEKNNQLNYHTLYFLQVLTLDCGTTAGLMVHSENDIGVLGSLPKQVSRNLLLEWIPRLPTPQNLLLTRFLELLPTDSVCFIGVEEKQKLADAIREHYLKFPYAKQLQAKMPNILKDEVT